MNFEEFSTEGLVSLYEAVRIALEEDDSRPEGNKKFGTREHGDWRQWSEAIAQELKRRGETIVALPW